MVSREHGRGARCAPAIVETKLDLRFLRLKINYVKENIL